MKTNDLAALTGISPETIRKYRDKGMLKPDRLPENGYFDYSYADFLNLLYIRKLRGANLSLDTILHTYTQSDTSKLLHGFQKELLSLEEEIAHLERRRHMLRLTLDHLERDYNTMDEVKLIEVKDAKWDAYFESGSRQSVIGSWIQNINLFTIVAGVKKESLEQNPLPARIPFFLGLGTYTYILEKHQLPYPEEGVYFPAGTYVSFFLELENLDYIPGHKLEPIADYIRTNRLTLDSGTTAYLYRVDTTGKKHKFIFAFRIKVIPE